MNTQSVRLEQCLKTLEKIRLRPSSPRRAKEASDAAQVLWQQPWSGGERWLEWGPVLEALEFEALGPLILKLVDMFDWPTIPRRLRELEECFEYQTMLLQLEVFCEEKCWPGIPPTTNALLTRWEEEHGQGAPLPEWFRRFLLRGSAGVARRDGSSTQFFCFDPMKGFLLTEPDASLVLASAEDSVTTLRLHEGSWSTKVTTRSRERDWQEDTGPSLHTWLVRELFAPMLASARAQEPKASAHPQSTHAVEDGELGVPELFGELRSLLNLPPSPESFERVCTFFDGILHLEPYFHDLLTYALDSIANWDDALRTCPPQWRNLLTSPRENPRFALVTTWTHPIVNDPQRRDAIVASPNARWIRRLRVSTTLELLLPWMQRDDVELVEIRPVVPKRGIMRSLDWLTLPKLRAVDTLSLRHQNVLARPLHAILSSPSWEKLHTLDLTDCRARVLGVQAIAQNPALSALERLSLRHNKMTEGSIEALIACTPWEHLTSLDLSRNPQVGDAGALRLLELRAPNLTHLNLEGCGVEDETRDTLLASRHLPKLESVTC